MTLLKGSNDYVIYCYASRIGLGFVLMHQDKDVTYASIKLKVHDKNYSTHVLELETVVFALNI